jgi:hypothetical protein
MVVQGKRKQEAGSGGNYLVGDRLPGVGLFAKSGLHSRCVYRVHVAYTIYRSFSRLFVISKRKGAFLSLGTSLLPRVS